MFASCAQGIVKAVGHLGLWMLQLEPPSSSSLRGGSLDRMFILVLRTDNLQSAIQEQATFIAGCSPEPSAGSSGSSMHFGLLMLFLGYVEFSCTQCCTECCVALFYAKRLPRVFL